ncbi:MAG TPA: endonuclease/exonuclease/phosphatase family protein [Chlamydiales bacterium]|nr:endonuclease/exonuclease/phosphatase family protein [Chlamydiales bacterium]
MNPLQPLENERARSSFNPDGQEHSNRVAAAVDKFGHVLTTPTTLFLQGAVRIFVLDFKPGFWGQQNSAIKEGFYRAGLFAGLLILSPFAILGALFGAPLRALTSFSKKDFVFHKQPPQNSTAQKVNSVSMISYNVLLMPEFISMRNKHRPGAERTEEIADSLIEKNPDFICLQEAFHAGHSAKLDAAFHKAGYNVIRNVGNQVFGMGSGLFLASKYELENVQFFPHPIKGGVEDKANKGVLIATAKVGDKRIVIANAHLNGGGDDENPGYVCRAIQTMAVTAHLNKYIKEAQAKGEKLDGAVLNSDTNIAATYYSDREASGKLKTIAEPEWLLANNLYEKMKKGDDLSIPQQVENPKAWEACKKKVIAAMQEVDKEVSGSEEDKRRKLNQLRGGPFPTELFHHDLDEGNAYDQCAHNGSSIDLEGDPEVGWGTKIATQPQRVDFILTRTGMEGLKEPKLQNVQVIPILSRQGKLTSDHNAVKADIVFS